MVKDACCCSRPSPLWRLKFGMLCGFGNKRENLGLFFELTYLDPALLFDFWGSWIYWTTFEVAISTWSILFLQQLHGLVHATPNIRGNLPSAHVLLLWVSLLFRQQKPSKSIWPTELWKLQLGLRSSRSNALPNSLDSTSSFPKT